MDKSAKTNTKELYLHHGRKTVDEELDDWGFDGPRLRGCIGIHQTYGSPANIFFETKEDADLAQRLTGWPKCEDNALTMMWLEGLVIADGKYYGDWGII